MAIKIYHGTSMDALARELGRVISAAELGPFDQEIVAVPDRGVQRWLDQMLSHYIRNAGGRAFGISAGIDYRRTGSLAELFLDGRREWEPTSLAWQILALAPMGRSIGYADARRIADLLLTYASQRPAMLRAWLAGEAVADGDGGEPLHESLRWQVQLFAELVDRIGGPPAGMDAERALDAARAHGVERVHVFGRRHFSQADLELLRRSGDELDVYVWLVGPSPSIWEPAGTEESVLLSVLGAQSRETAQQLRAALPGVSITAVPEIDHREESLLRRVQADIELDRRPSTGSSWDGSIQVHATHGPSRQVEVLREALTGLFEEEPHLEPRDVLILCPDLDEYAPLFASTFNSGTSHPGHHLRVQVAGARNSDRNPLAELLLKVMDYALDRIRAVDLVDLLHREEVQRRVGITDANIETLHAWVKDSGIRWGFDAEDRRRFELETDQNTVEFGLRRLIVGLALAGEDPLQGVLPLEAAGSVDVDLLGAFIEFLSRLREGVTSLHSATTVGALGESLRRLLGSIALGDEGQEAHIARILTRIVSYGHTPASIGDVRALLADLTEPSGRSLNLRTGGVTVTSLGMLSGVKHEVVCLVGMDDGHFPRTRRPSGEDVLGRHPRGGEWSAGSEDRQSFLDALCSATSKLIITYSGAGESRGERRVPATPVAQLLDDLEIMTGEKRVITHPLHAFDRKYFTGGELWSFDERAARAARVHQDPEPEPPLEPPQEVPPLPELTTLSELLAFVRDPVRTFFEKTLGVYLLKDDDGLSTSIPIAPSHLEGWAIGTRILDRAAQAGWTVADSSIEAFSGALPPGSLGEHVREEFEETVGQIVNAAAEIAVGEAVSVDIDIDLEATTLSGRIDRLHGDHLVDVTYSTPKVRHWISAWVRLLALKVADPERSWQATVIGRGYRKVSSKTLRAPEADTARDHLGQILNIYRRGLAEPVPLPLETAYAWACRIGEGRAFDEWRPEAVSAASAAWTTNDERRGSKEDCDGYQQLAWGGIARFEEILRIPARPEERWKGEHSRFGSLAARLLKGMIDNGG